MIRRLQRQVGRKLDGQHASTKALCKLELQSATNLPSGYKHVKVVWANESGEEKGSSTICAVSSSAALTFPMLNTLQCGLHRATDLDLLRIDMCRHSNHPASAGRDCYAVHQQESRR